MYQNIREHIPVLELVLELLQMKNLFFEEVIKIAPPLFVAKRVRNPLRMMHKKSANTQTLSFNTNSLHILKRISERNVPLLCFEMNKMLLFNPMGLDRA